VETAFIVSYAILWLLVLIGGFVLFAAIRQIGILSWRLEQLAATTPSRIERNGLKSGARAPDFALPDTSGKEHALRDYRGRETLLVFAQPGCGPCTALVPELNAFVDRRRLAVVAISNAEPEANLRWQREVGARFPVLSQERWSVSKEYQTFASPFAFLVDGEGVIRAQGIVNKKQHIDLLLSSAKRRKEKEPEPAGSASA